MSTFGSYSVAQLGSLRAELKELGSACSNLREAGGIVLDRLFAEFGDSLVLARLFGTVPFAFLPEREQGFARRIAEQRSLSAELTPDTIVVTLLASRGRRPEWNDPSSSRRRLAIPILNESSFDAIPLIGRLLSDTKLGEAWSRKQETLARIETAGGMSQLLHVSDARTMRSSDGRPAVPDQDFVADNGVRTVLVLGGSYLNGCVIALILFTTELLTEEQSAKFTPLVNTIKSATMKPVMAGRIL